MKNPKVGAVLIILILVLAALAPVAWKQLNREAKAETDDQQTEADKPECKGGPSDVTHGHVIAIGADTSYPKKGEMVTFEGYVEMPNLTYLNGGAYMVNLCADSALEGSDITLLIKEGDCENTMVPVPDDYDYSDLMIRDNSGSKLMHGGKIRVTGKVNDDGPLYTVYVKRIDKL